ncbi:MAG: protein-glutamate O-methyltransferase CheR [Myxococcota bacterium]
MRRESFEQIRSLIRQRASIVLEEGKEYLVETRLKPVARAQGLQDVDQLCDRLDRGRNRALADLVVDAMTTNETSFFRDAVPFDVMLDVVLPEVMRHNAASKTLRIWSAACSTGQEPYSVAMLIADHFPALAEWDVQILASDLSQSVLLRAERGEYRQVEVNRGLSAPQLMRHFERRGMVWRLHHRLRARVSFQQLNLTEAWSGLPTFDIVLLRNVLIYFDVADKDAVLRRMVGQIRPDGFLFLGGSESPPSGNQWQRVEVPRSGCYRRVEAF